MTTCIALCSIVGTPGTTPVKITSRKEIPKDFSGPQDWEYIITLLEKKIGKNRNFFVVYSITHL